MATRECLRARHEFFKRWPNACKVCDGRGFSEENDHSVNAIRVDQCPSCKSDCPRCGSCEMDFDIGEGDGLCPVCGWDGSVVIEHRSGWREMEAPSFDTD